MGAGERVEIIYMLTISLHIIFSVALDPVHLTLEAEYMFGDVSGVDHEHDGYSIQASYASSNAPAGSWELVYRYSKLKMTTVKLVLTKSFAEQTLA